MLIVENLLPKQDVDVISKLLDDVEFQDGKATAGWHAKLVKNNEQAIGNQKSVEQIQNTVLQAIQNNAAIRSACMPSRISPLLISRYQKGMEYGLHVDDAIRTGNSPMRADISFTVFLSDPKTYEGGELNTINGSIEQNIKLEAGSAVFYPSNMLHKVQPIVSGQRLAAVGWMQSMVRSPEHREILHDLDRSRRQIFDQHGKTEVFDALSKTQSNLMRMWVH